MYLYPVARTALLALAALTAAAGVAVAQAPLLEPSLEHVQFAPRGGNEPRMRGGVQGRFDYYALVMSWSPTFCAGEARAGDMQCKPRPRPFAFILHGLWQQHERGYPEYCPTAERPFVQQSTIDRMHDIMPSRNLIIHEYKKHGVCTGLGPEGYYDLSRKLFTKIKVPNRFVEPTTNQFVDTSTVVSEFVAANPGLKPDMIAVVCGGPGDRLREVRVCFSRQGEFRACGGNENPRRLCAASRVFVPPVRAGRDTPTGGRQPSSPMLPGPTAPSGQRAL